MICAKLTQIHLFATGGIGDVHLKAEDSFDISAELYAFSHIDCIVVTAGAKAILDIAKTLEVLETLGIPVIGYRTDIFPAFWSQCSGLQTSMQLTSPKEIANLFLTRKAINQKEGMLIANPVPKINEIPRHKMEPLIQ